MDKKRFLRLITVMFAKKKQNEENLLCLIDLFLKRHSRKIRGPYNISMYNPVISEILCGNEVLTKRHIRINNKSFKLLSSYFPKKNKGWDQEIEIVIFLYWLACGTSYRVVAMSFSMPLSTVFDIVKKYLDLMLKLAPKVIKIPEQEHLESMGIGFAMRARNGAFNKAVGAIDGCHIRVLCPTALHNQYINRKLSYSTELQAVCDAQYYITDAFAGYPGSVHDMRVLKHTPLYQKGNFPPEGYYLLGDSGYANRLRPVPIFTPYKGSNLTERQKLFNKHHSHGRNIIERVFGMMKARWRAIFTKAFELRLAKCVKVIASCTVMHNICVSAGDLIEPAKLAERKRFLPYGDRDEVDGALLREQITNNM